MRGIPICMPCQSALRAYTIADSVLFKIIRLYLYPMAYEQMQGGQCIMNCARLMVSHACLACNAFVCVVCAVCMRQHQWHAYYRNYMGAVSGINVQYNQWQHMCCVQPVYWRGISLLWGRVHWRVKANRQIFLFSVISLVKICVRSAGVDRSRTTIHITLQHVHMLKFKATMCTICTCATKQMQNTYITICMCDADKHA